MFKKLQLLEEAKKQSLDKENEAKLLKQRLEEEEENLNEASLINLKYEMDIQTHQSISKKIVSEEEFHRTKKEYEHKIQKCNDAIELLKRKIESNGLDLNRANSAKCTITHLPVLKIRSQGKVAKLEDKVKALSFKVKKSQEDKKKKSTIEEEIEKQKERQEHYSRDIEAAQANCKQLNDKIQRMAVILVILLCSLLALSVAAWRR